MLLSVKQKGQRVSELHFQKGPIYIGRQMGSQVFLPQTGVSRQHAVMYTNTSGQWIIEDLDSVNKTFVNHEPVHTCVLKQDDKIDIFDFTIEVAFTEESPPEKPPSSIHLEDTIMHEAPEINATIINPEVKNALPISFPSKRLKDIYNATLSIQKANTIKDLHGELISILLSQFASHSTWAALRKNPDGGMNVEGGRHINRSYVDPSELYVNNYIAQALDKHKNVLIPQLPRSIGQNNLRSVIIAPIMAHKKCHGYLYVNNSKEHEHYDNADLEYLMVLASMTAAAMQRL